MVSRPANGLSWEVLPSLTRQEELGVGQWNVRSVVSRKEQNYMRQSSICIYFFKSFSRRLLNLGTTLNWGFPARHGGSPSSLVDLWKIPIQNGGRFGLGSPHRSIMLS